MTRLVAYGVSLPRWFALPVAVLAIVLGGILSHASAGMLALAVIAGAFLMAYSHSWNSFHDWVIGLDKGEASERSHEKPYTLGQNLIARGLITHYEALLVALVYLLTSAILTVPIALTVGHWVWLPWSLIALMAPLYSWGKLHYSCEFFLGLGFGPLAVMFGAAAAADPNLIKAFLAGIPFGIIFGYAAETVDQALDADANIPKGLRNIGALVWKRKWRLSYAIFAILSVAVLAHALLIAGDIFKPQTAWALVAILAYAPFMHKLDPAPTAVSIMAGLVAIFIYSLLLVVLQAL